MNTAIEIEEPEAPENLKALEIGFAIFLRFLAACFLVMTVWTWSSAVGFLNGGEGGFDEMGNAMRIYIAVLAVLHPVASVGLWTALSWGRVVWFMAVGFQLAFMFNGPAPFTLQNEIAIFHLGCLAIYIVFQIAFLRIARKK